MGNVGFGEIFVLFLVLLIAVGPKKLPEIARNLGKAYRTFTSEMQKAQESLRVAVEEEERVAQPAGGGVIDVPDAPLAPPIAQAVAPVASPESAPAPTAPAAAPAPYQPPDHAGVVRDYEDT